MYLSVCDSAKFNETCKTQNSVNSTSSENSYSLSDKRDIIKDFCTSVREFYSSGPETFVETFMYGVPLCSFVSRGFQSEELEKFNVTFWDCIPKRLVVFLFQFYF